MKKKLLSVLLILMCSLALIGCTGVEPEKRAYPQVLALDQTKKIQVIFGMPNMQSATGQEKPQEEAQNALLAFEGRNLSEINEHYNRTQEKYLDLGHLNVLILGKGILKGRHWEQALSNLKEDNQIGEDIYVFCTDDIEKVMEYNGNQIESIGDYLMGIYENRPYGNQKKGVTLRQVYKVWYETGELCALPEIVIDKQGYPEIQEDDSQKFTLLQAWWGTLYPRFCYSQLPENADEKGVKIKLSFKWL